MTRDDPTRLCVSLNDASCFAHRIDPVGETIEFVRTDATALRMTPFLDGRTRFWDGAPEFVSLRDVLAEAPDPADGPDRIIFHMSFCGSTLLATLLDRVARATVLKEPQALVDMADWAVAVQRRQRLDALLQPSLHLARDLLRRPFSGGDPVVFKPSNWVNSLIPRLCADATAIRPLFITIDRAAFVAAVLRGGRDRLVYNARVAGHLAGVFDGADALIAEAAAASDDPLTRVVNLAVVTHHLQTILFNRAIDAGAWGDGCRLDFSTIQAHPLPALLQATEALGVDPMSGDLAPAVAEVVRINAKQPDRLFSKALRAKEDAQVQAVYGSVIAAAMDWGDRCLPEAKSLRLAA